MNNLNNAIIIEPVKIDKAADAKRLTAYAKKLSELK